MRPATPNGQARASPAAKHASVVSFLQGSSVIEICIRARLQALLSVPKLPQRLFIDLKALGIGQDVRAPRHNDLRVDVCAIYYRHRW